MIHEHQDILNILQKIVALLIDNDQPRWADMFILLKHNYSNNPRAVKEQILSLYGGMGSFNDLVLCHNGVPLITENDTLERLRHMLYIKLKMYQ